MTRFKNPTTVFFTFYPLLLSIPFIAVLLFRSQFTAMLGERWWLIPLVGSTILATIGPLIYLRIQKRAEEHLAEEQRRYQSTLRRASLGMGQIKDLQKLLKLIVHMVKRAVKVEHCAIYLQDTSTGRYLLRACRPGDLKRQSSAAAVMDPFLVSRLKETKDPLIINELSQPRHRRGLGIEEEKRQRLITILQGMRVSLVVPSFVEQKLIAIFILGRLNSGTAFRRDDLAVFSILANQSALAIENALFYDQMNRTHEQLYKAEKMATIGTMADGLSHQINNRLHAMGFIAGDALDSVRGIGNDRLAEADRQLFRELEYALGRIEANVRHGGAIVEGLLKYTRKSDEGFGLVDLEKIIDAALEMVQFKVQLEHVVIKRHLYPHLPALKGNFTQLQEVFFNIIDNAYDAIMQRETEWKEGGGKGEIEITAVPKGKKMEIVIKDNGVGVREEDIPKVFTPFFTTKLSSIKGTGLGLYMIRQIIEEHHGGRVEFLSQYGRGAQIHIWLPVETGEGGGK